MATNSNAETIRPWLPGCLGATVFFIAACSDAPTAVHNIDTQPHITVYKSESCGCCQKWADYLQEEGFRVTAINHENMDAKKAELGLPFKPLQSCHTAVVDNYVIEGHVPASDILRLLKEQPEQVKGLTAPGMPMLSPGMGSREPADYAVLSFTATGDTQLYSQY